MKKIIIVILILFLLAYLFYPSPVKLSEEATASNQFIASWAASLYRDYDLQLSGFGGGVDKGINNIAVCLDKQCISSPNNAEIKQLGLGIIIHAIAHINQDEELLKVLNPDFNFRNIDIYLVFRNQNNENYYDPDYSSAMLYNGNIKLFKTASYQNPRFTHKETLTIEDLITELGYDPETYIKEHLTIHRN